MTFYTSGDYLERIGEYRTITEARVEAVKFMKKFPKAYSLIIVRDGRKIVGAVYPQFGTYIYSTQGYIKGKNGVKYVINSDGTLGNKVMWP